MLRGVTWYCLLHATHVMRAWPYQKRAGVSCTDGVKWGPLCCLARGWRLIERVASTSAGGYAISGPLYSSAIYNMKRAGNDLKVHAYVCGITH